MHNLAKDEEQSVQVEESVTEVPTPDIQIISEDESGVQICVNGITHHSSDDIKLDTSLNKFIKDYYGDNLPGVRRRSSWCPQTTIEVDDLRNKYVNQSNFSQGKRYEYRHSNCNQFSLLQVDSVLSLYRKEGQFKLNADSYNYS